MARSVAPAGRRQLVPGRPPGGRRGWPRRHRVRRRRGGPVGRVVLGVVAVLVVVAGWSVGHALTVPGGGSFAERIAEWARGHELGPLVTFGEWLSYSPPRTGGRPSVSFNKLGGTPVRGKRHYAGLVPVIPARLGSPAGRP